jgi:hypothetical protein
MDERLRICLWMVGGGAVGSVLGGIFGGLTAALFARSGHAAGTGFARRIADSFAQTAERKPSLLGRAIFIGATDGLIFLGIFGLVAGSLMGTIHRPTHEWLQPALFGVVLVGGAIFFGLLAYAMSHGARTVGSVIGGGLLGASLIAWRYGVDHLLFGVVLGFLGGLLFSLAVQRRSRR